MSTPEKRDIVGGCHCGFIRYTISIPFDPATHPLSGNRCNCTFCQKFRTTNIALDSAADFQLLSPASRDELGSYAPRNKNAQRYFCPRCSVHVWMEGFYEHGGKRVDLFMVNMPTIDQPQGDVDLSKAKIKYWDGLNNNFAAGLRDEPWPNGLL